MAALQFGVHEFPDIQVHELLLPAQSDTDVPAIYEHFVIVAAKHVSATVQTQY